MGLTAVLLTLRKPLHSSKLDIDRGWLRLGDFLEDVHSCQMRENCLTQSPAQWCKYVGRLPETRLTCSLPFATQAHSFLYYFLLSFHIFALWILQQWWPRLLSWQNNKPFACFTPLWRAEVSRAAKVSAVIGSSWIESFHLHHTCQTSM